MSVLEKLLANRTAKPSAPAASAPSVSNAEMAEQMIGQSGHVAAIEAQLKESMAQQDLRNTSAYRR